MRNLRWALEGLREDLARTHAEITIAERTVRQLAMVTDRGGNDPIDSVRRSELNWISDRLAIARLTQSTIAMLMDECGRKRSARRYHAEETAKVVGAFDALVGAAGSNADACGA